MNEKTDSNLYLPMPAELVRVESLTPYEKLFEVKLSSNKKLGHQPGQFVEVSLLGIGEAPISVSSPPMNSSSKNNTFELCIRKAGNVTNALHNLKAGAEIGIRGPFGNGFPLKALEGNNIVFIAGGIGIVPLRSLIKNVLANHSKYNNISIIYGAKSAEEMLFLDEIDEWKSVKDVKVMLTIDKPAKGWKGRVGVVTTLFHDVDFDAEDTYAVVVGPPIMYKFVMMALGSRNIPDNRIYMSLERRMKCGIGKCGHCQIGSMYACKHGPVFSYNEIKHMKGVI